MPNPLRFVIVLHNHQPVGNFDGVIEQAYQDSYLPFLEVFERGALTTLHTFNRLYDADGDGSFSLVKTGSTISTDLFDSNSATWADLNNDGYLDLLAGPGWFSLATARVYMNQGNGSFLSVQAGDLTRYSSHNLKLGVDYDQEESLKLSPKGEVEGLHLILKFSSQRGHSWAYWPRETTSAN